jgi:hypothetical protein
VNERAFDAKRANDVFDRLITDEELYEATLLGRHRELAGSRRLDDEELAILDAFHARPGTKWNIDNIRFRATGEVADKIGIWLPRTVQLITGGNPDWLMDLSFEYLVHHRWQELGHNVLAECDRFAAFVRKRVMFRRPTHPALDSVLRFETALLATLRKTRGVAADAFPDGRRPDDDALAHARPCLGPAVSVVELPMNISAWIRSGDPKQGEVTGGPISVLIYVPSLEEKYRIQTLAEGARLVLERCNGERTTEELAAELGEAFELEPEEVYGVVGRLLEARVLRVDREGGER